MFRSLSAWASSFFVLCALLSRSSAAQSIPVDSVQFQDGNVLGVLGDYGSGSNTAYRATGLYNIPASYVWQFNWDPSTSVNGWQMMEDIAGQSILSTSGTPGSNTV